jgi:hypothetical protein
MQKVGTDEIESHIFWSLLKSYDIVDCFLFKIGVLDLEKNEFFKFKFFTVDNFLFPFFIPFFKFTKLFKKLFR